METIDTTELRERLAGNFQGVLLDVREPAEYATASIPGARLIPLGTLPEHLDVLPRDREILVHCKAGGRSAKAVALLTAAGFSSVKNVTGGIDAWLAADPK